MSKVTVVAQVTAKTDAVETVKAELIKMLSPTRQEDGCLEYRLHQDPDNPALFIFYENWKNQYCLDRHMNSDHFQEYIAAVGDLIADKVVHMLSEIV